MGAALGRRAVSAVATLLLVTVVVFGLIHLSPGDPLAGVQSDDGLMRLSNEARERLREHYGLDRPVHEQYLRWLRDLARGELGESFHDRRPVASKIAERLGLTVTLNLLALLLTVLVALPLGAAAALAPGSTFDRLTAGGGYALYAVPVFWAGLLLQLLFAVQLDWLPLAGLRSTGHEFLSGPGRLLDRAAHLVLPVLCLGYGGIAYLARFVRATLIESEAGTSWRAARARGLSLAAVLVRHGLRQAGLPLLTLVGFLIPGLVGGSVIVETVFSVPGLGRLFVDAAFQRDIPVLMGLTLLSGVATVAGIALADAAYLLCDPRARRG